MLQFFSYIKKIDELKLSPKKKTMFSVNMHKEAQILSIEITDKEIIIKTIENPDKEEKTKKLYIIGEDAVIPENLYMSLRYIKTFIITKLQNVHKKGKINPDFISVSIAYFLFEVI